MSQSDTHREPQDRRDWTAWSVESRFCRISTVCCRRFCHATPRDDEEVVLVDSPPSRWQEVYADLPDDVLVVVCGHTHMPFVRQFDRRLVVNSGSVGMPYGAAGPHWALLGSGVELRRTELDLDAAAARVATDSAYENVRAWVDEYIVNNASDLEALAAFTPRTRVG